MLSMDEQASKQRQHDARRYDTMQCDAMRTIDRQADSRTSVDVDQGVRQAAGSEEGCWPGCRWALEVGDETRRGCWSGLVLLVKCGKVWMIWQTGGGDSGTAGQRTIRQDQRPAAPARVLAAVLIAELRMSAVRS